MAELTIRLIEQASVLENLLLNELSPLVEPLDKDASVFVSVTDGKVDLKFVGVDDVSRANIKTKAEEVMNAFMVNQ